MKFWTQLKTNLKVFGETPDGKKLKVILPFILIIMVMAIYLASNPIVLSIEYSEGAYDNYVENRTYGMSFYTTESGTFYTTHGISAWSIEVNYLFAPSENLWKAFDNGHITIEDLDRLDFDYWFKPNDK